MANKPKGFTSKREIAGRRTLEEGRKRVIKNSSQTYNNSGRPGSGMSASNPEWRKAVTQQDRVWRKYAGKTGRLHKNDK